MFLKIRNSENQTRANFTDTPPPPPQDEKLTVLSERDLFTLLGRHLPAFADINSKSQYDAVRFARHARRELGPRRRGGLQPSGNPSAEQRDMQDRARAQGEGGAVVDADAVEAPPWVGDIADMMTSMQGGMMIR